MNFVYFGKFYVLYHKGSINIPEYRCFLIGCVQYLYIIEHAEENIASVSIDLCNSLSLAVTGHILNIILAFMEYYFGFKCLFQNFLKH